MRFSIFAAVVLIATMTTCYAGSKAHFKDVVKNGNADSRTMWMNRYAQKAASVNPAAGGAKSAESQRKAAGKSLYLQRNLNKQPGQKNKGNFLRALSERPPGSKDPRSQAVKNARDKDATYYEAKARIATGASKEKAAMKAEILRKKAAGEKLNAGNMGFLERRNMGQFNANNA
ncbi:hypothetical protein GQ42DRAFT_181680 [Ramicandelaber brevisporus]|nr:hypothetical protein GQ42DRAFT_181680 [Ramicandelaber brevisporus]